VRINSKGIELGEVVGNLQKENIRGHGYSGKTNLTGLLLKTCQCGQVSPGRYWGMRNMITIEGDQIWRAEVGSKVFAKTGFYMKVHRCG
jgi:hypothetical protein